MRQTYLAYARGGTEFAVADELTALGITVWCGRAVQSHFDRRSQEYEVHVTPALPNYLFLEMTPEEYHELQGMRGRPKYLRQRLDVLTDGSRRDFEAFRAMVDMNEGAAWHRISRNERPEITFSPGDALESGQFPDLSLQYRDVKRDQGVWKIEAEAEMMGRTVKVMLDPGDVKKAG